ncbi:hypothetical protein ACJX0J_028691, partial [Zea mays]
GFWGPANHFFIADGIAIVPEAILKIFLYSFSKKDTHAGEIDQILLSALQPVCVRAQGSVPECCLILGDIRLIDSHNEWFVSGFSCLLGEIFQESLSAIIGMLVSAKSSAMCCSLGSTNRSVAFLQIEPDEKPKSLERKNLMNLIFNSIFL